MSSNKKIKILIATYGFFPAQKYGGPPVSIENFCDNLPECDVYIVTRNHEMGENQPLSDLIFGWNERHNCSVKYLSDKEYNADNLGKLMDEIGPNLVYIQTFFECRTFVSAIKAAYKRGIPILLAPRGELLMGAMKKKYKKIPYIWAAKCLWLRENVYYQATSGEEYDSILRYLTKKRDKVFNLSNFPCATEKICKSCEQKDGALRVITLTRIVPKKNVLFACEVMMDVKEELIWDIYGPIEDEAYWNECLNVIEKLPDNIHISYKGVVSHDKVFETMRRYQVYFFPTKSENYGHSIVEAMMIGCIPVISDKTPWVDLEQHGAGYSLELSDKYAFSRALSKTAKMSGEELKNMSDKVIEYIDHRLNVEKLKMEYMKMLFLVKGND